MKKRAVLMTFTLAVSLILAGCGGGTLPLSADNQRDERSASPTPLSTDNQSNARTFDFRDIEFAKLAWYLKDEDTSEYGDTSFYLYDNDNDGINELYGERIRLVTRSSFENGRLQLRLDSNSHASGDIVITHSSVLDKLLLKDGRYGSSSGYSSYTIMYGVKDGEVIYREEWDHNLETDKIEKTVTRYEGTIDGKGVKNTFLDDTMAENSGALLNCAVDYKGSTLQECFSAYEKYAKTCQGYAGALTADIDQDGTKEMLCIFNDACADAINNAEAYLNGTRFLKDSNIANDYPDIYFDGAYRAPTAVIADDIDGKAVFMTVQLSELPIIIDDIQLENGKVIIVSSDIRHHLDYVPDVNSFEKPVLKIYAAPKPSASSEAGGGSAFYSSYAHMVSFDPVSGTAKFDYYNLLIGKDAYNYYIENGYTQAEAEEFMGIEDMSGVEVNNNPKLRTAGLHNVSIGLLSYPDGEQVEGTTPVPFKLEDLRALYRVNPNLVLNFDYWIEVKDGEVISIEQVYMA